MPMTAAALDHLRRRFEDGRVPLRLAPRPFVHGRGWVVVSRDTMTIDIRPVAGAPVPGETVLLWPGDARIEVVAVDRGRRQVVLRVEEGVRYAWARDFRLRNHWIRRPILPDSRTLLVGMDEAHLFMSRVAGTPRSVAEAHAVLAPAEVHAARREGRRVPRQGEHFFLPITPAERDAIDEALSTGRAVPRAGAVIPSSRGVAVRRPGKPHRAAESVIVGGRQFVRGVVRHPDHHALRLRDWARPELNTELDARIVRGVTWID